MASVEAFIAANRFGLGARPGELDEIARDPRVWIASQISGVHEIPAALRDMPPSHDTLKTIHEARMQGSQALRSMARRNFRQIMFREINARARAMIQSRQSFRERMVLFWANHFTVSATRSTVGPVSGAYEREAIRPYIFGHFEDMLLATARHPAMLTYLANARSIGPNSRTGERTGRGLNENLAREILELHTLGVNGGYTQNDVTEFANILTGWSHGGLRKRRSDQSFGPVHGKFEFRDCAHEPGSKLLLGKRYSENGEQEGIDALKGLARHSSTAKSIATKLARHFIADDPPADTVRRLERVFRESGGHLGAVSRELIRLDAVWKEPLAKVKTPYELVISTMRAVDVNLDELRPRAILGSLQQMGHVPFRAPSPKGWPDRAQDWISPESLLRRIDWLRSASALLPRTLQPNLVAEQTIAPVMAPRTQEMIDAAPSGEEALAMIFASPEFQRR